MAQGLRSLRWRAAISIVGALLVFGWVTASGRTSYLVQIDWSWGRDVLRGAVVEIDGDSVGTLEPYGRSQRVTGFRVEPGEHVVRVLHDGCEGVPERVHLGAASTRLVVLTADVDDGHDCRVVLR